MESVIEVNQLVKKYRKAEKPAVDGISFEVGKGEFFALLGPNGAGKTTTISILTTTLTKTSGSVRIAGWDIEKDAAQVRRNVGIIFQNPSLDLDLTAEENIRLHASIYGVFPYRPLYRMMPAAYRKRVEELAEVVGLRDNLFRKTRGFSGGMKRKLEIMRSLIHKPQILFLDEPTQGLDASARQSIWAYLKQLRQEENLTVFLTTHYLEEAEEADRVCMVTGGRIAVLGTPDKIKRQLAGPERIMLGSEELESLKSELDGLGVAYEQQQDTLAVFPGQRSAQQIVSGIRTPLSRLDIRQPTLEEAYLSLIQGGEAV
ncbi:ABC transporter ATP-binding protein [Paenibacillus herberti]|uniref:ABC transporter ATP-binding protein n=1 Tax=Paenibacillus herberti TaxID=1619309 RepID=A0A229P4Z5_9BACL|nr:ABC transporter ATP-binding protein [Paenibacillus herberti]OXM16929.1 ABC transporter ATP-binding protein [Paenibacillus herberti]